MGKEGGRRNRKEREGKRGSWGIKERPRGEGEREREIERQRTKRKEERDKQN